jgi:hypothetical protein
MGDLVLTGKLNLAGQLDLKGDGGKVKVDANEILVVQQIPGKSHGTGPPVILPPPPVGPVDAGPNATIFMSFNATVTINGIAAVATGLHLQGNTPTWPGMVQPSSINTGVTANNAPINVQNDTGVTLPNGGTVTYDTSGQQ